MSKRERIAHTASFLQTFHTGVSASGRNYRAETAAEYDEERAALDFISGTGTPTQERREQRAQTFGNSSRKLIEVQGWKVLTGPGMTTEPQAKYMISIAGRPSVTDAMRQSLKVRLEQGFARSAASDFISKYKDIPTAAAETARNEAIHAGSSAEEVREAAKQGPIDVPAGRYAVEEGGVLKFFRVTIGKGRWAGRTFLEIQASNDRYTVRNPDRRNAILMTIAEDLLAAEQRYGRELGKCSRCGRTLTDPESRAYGIGPDCRNK